MHNPPILDGLRPTGALAKAPRIPSLDIIRGVAILGVLAVNADGFAVPIHASLNPQAWPFGNGGATAFSYWVMDWLFHEKFVAIFSMLFGISLFLVGGELTDRKRGTNLARRLAALFAFALIHGFVLWWGDILFTYATAGVVLFALRSLPPRLLLTGGVALLFFTLSQSLPVHAGTPPASGTTMADTAAVAARHALAQANVARELAEGSGSASGAFALNARTYVHQLQNVWRVLPTTIGLMMIGLALFKTGFFGGGLPSPVYRRVMLSGASILVILGWVTWRQDIAEAPLAWGHVLEVALSPLAALGYVAAIILLVRAMPGRWLAPFAAAGRMAFTNYLTQSLIMTSIFYGGRGALMGQVDRPALWAIVAGIWILQLAWSPLWLSRFEMGPLEWLWRWITYGRRSPFVRRPIPQEVS